VITRTAERALVLLAGPPDEMDRKGIEKAKSWVEEISPVLKFVVAIIPSTANISQLLLCWHRW